MHHRGRLAWHSPKIIVSLWSKQKTMKNTQNPSNTPPSVFGKQNYILLIVSVLIIALGYILMLLDNEPFGFGFLGLTLGPIVSFLGFMMVFVALFYKKKKNPEA
jgi:uncharacterized membrane protein